MSLVNSFKYYFKRIKNSNKLYYDINGYHHFRSIFIHVPKTGGVSIAQSIFDSLGGGHISYKQYESIFSEAERAEYFKFSFVREPIGRFISAINYLSTTKDDKKNVEWAEKYLNVYNGDLNMFVQREFETQAIVKYHLKTQSSYLLSSNGNLELDFIGKYENLNNDFRFVCDKLGIKNELKVRNQSKDNFFNADMLSTESMQILKNHYSSDFLLFNY